MKRGSVERDFVVLALMLVLIPSSLQAPRKNSTTGENLSKKSLDPDLPTSTTAVIPYILHTMASPNRTTIISLSSPARTTHTSTLEAMTHQVDTSSEGSSEIPSVSQEYDWILQPLEETWSFFLDVFGVMDSNIEEKEDKPLQINQREHQNEMKLFSKTENHYQEEMRQREEISRMIRVRDSQLKIDQQRLKEEREGYGSLKRRKKDDDLLLMLMETPKNYVSLGGFFGGNAPSIKCEDGKVLDKNGECSLRVSKSLKDYESWEI